MKVQILVDNIKSWMVPYARVIVDDLCRLKVDAELIHEIKDIEQGEILFLLSCEKIIKKAQLELHRHNLVIHASDLPRGKGWSPLTWQILEGADKIPLTMIEADSRVDSGAIYEKIWIDLDGTELIDELRSKLVVGMSSMIKSFVLAFPNNRSELQVGEESFYPKRSPEDSALMIDKTIGEQFNLFRIADNERYPAFFFYKGQKFILKIEKVKND